MDAVIVIIMIVVFAVGTLWSLGLMINAVRDARESKAKGISIKELNAIRQEVKAKMKAERPRTTEELLEEASIELQKAHEELLLERIKARTEIVKARTEELKTKGV